MNYLLKFVMAVKSSTSPWKVSIKMESTEIYHETSSPWTRQMYGIHACSMWLPSHMKNIRLERDFRLGSAKRKYSNL
jgi:hypothetical protein